MKSNYDVRIHSPYDLKQTWYVYVVKNGIKVHQISKGINKLTTFEDRMMQCLSIKSFLESEIKNGAEFDKSMLPNADKFNYSILEAYEIAMNHIYEEGLSKSTVSHYKTHHKQLVEAIKELKFGREKMRDFEPYHISLILEECQKLNNGSNDFYNKHLKSCKRVFSVMVKKFMVKSNPASDFPNL